MRYRSIGLLSAGHLFTDINQGAIPALLPFFIAHYHLTYAAAATIVFAANIASSVVQPLFGHMSDRLSKPWLMPAGVFVAGLGIGLAGVAGNFLLILLAVAVSGIGVSSFHPEAARLANNLAAESKATGLSIFAIGGNLGFALGPVVATGALLFWGVKGTLVFAVPSLITAIIIYRQFGATGGSRAGRRQAQAAEPRQAVDRWSPFMRLSGAVVARSILFYGLNTFLPLYWIHVLHESAAFGGMTLTILFTVGVFGTLLGGRLADRYGYRKIMLAGWVALLPLMLAFPYIHNTVLATALIIPISLGMFMIYSPMMVTGQGYLPNRVGFASGVTIGLAVSIGGVAAPVLGWIADGYGIEIALKTLVFMPLVATAFTLTLPADKAAAPQAD